MHEVQGFFCKTVVLWINSKLQNWEKTWYGPHLTSPIEEKARGAAHPGPWAGRWSRRAGRGAGSNEEARSGQRSEQRRGTSRWLTRSTRAPTPVDEEGSIGAAAGNRGNGGGLALDSARASRGEIRRGDLAERGRTGTGRIRGQGGGLGRQTKHSFVSHERKQRKQKCRGSPGDGDDRWTRGRIRATGAPAEQQRRRNNWARGRKLLSTAMEESSCRRR